MKRCPQCEFIYEDDQSLCDMDGVLLVFDSRTLPNLHALAPVESPLAPRVHWRHRTFPAVAALILATVLSLVYFVSTQRKTYPVAPIDEASTTAPLVDPIPTDTQVDANPPSPPADESGAREEMQEQQTTKPATSKAAKKAAAKTETSQTKPAEEKKKDDSKVETILKKTGRILKKPFKF